MRCIFATSEWSGKKKFKKRLAKIVLGYLAAVLVATIIVILPFDELRKFGGWAFIGGYILTVLAGLLPTVLFIFISEVLGRLGPRGHMVVGGLVAVTAHLLFASLDGSLLINKMGFSIVFVSIIAGSAGAFIYWKIAVAYLQDDPFRIDIGKARSVF